MEKQVNSATGTAPHLKRRNAIQSTLIFLFLGDLMISIIACILAHFIRFDWAINIGSRLGSSSLSNYMVHISLGSGTMAMILYLSGMYRIETITRYRFSSLCMITCSVYWGLLFLFLSLFFRIDPEISRLWVFYATTLAGIGLCAWRYNVCRYLISRQLLQNLRRKTLIVGWNDMAQRCYDRSKSADNGGDFFPFKVQSVLSYYSGTQQTTTIPNEIYHGCGLTEIEKAIHRGSCDTLIVADTNLQQKHVLQLQVLCGREMIDFMVIPDFIHTLTSCLRIESFAGLAMLTQNQRSVNNNSSRIIKRVIDIVGSLAGLAIFSPIIAYFAWRVYRESPGPVFYKQKRLGFHGQQFEIIKIRSMRLDAEAGTGAIWCSEEDPRRLKVGAFIREHNIDELPQFWNVLKGEMSLVGPRPERPELIQDFKHQISFYNVRHLVKPGITGWAQINGWRGDTCLESRVACDLEYIERWSPWFDLYICLRTIRAKKNAY
jgi:exopolysaccharide biosynthesis polyprenyl glycosylphosphotransferase